MFLKLTNFPRYILGASVQSQSNMMPGNSPLLAYPMYFQIDELLMMFHGKVLNFFEVMPQIY